MSEQFIRETVRYRERPLVVAGEPGRSGLHGEWLSTARAILHGADTTLAISRELVVSPGEAARVVEQMIDGNIVFRAGSSLRLSRRGHVRVRQAEENGR